MPITKPTLPAGMSSGDLADLLNQIGKVDVYNIYAGIGNLTAAEIAALFASQETINTELASNLEELGELAEKPFKAESKTEKLKTRHYQLEGKRTNVITVTIVGISEDKKNWLEDQSAGMTELTFIALSKDKSQAILINGCRWTVDWSGEADGLYTQEVTTEFTGKTSEKIVFFNQIPPTVV
ncbi:MAG: hypothetical protein KAH23_08385 [Kiritimatiellae bacterium]|nr:hypothetical protein [Kiritimatiellia bacterium]